MSDYIAVRGEGDEILYFMKNVQMLVINLVEITLQKKKN